MRLLALGLLFPLSSLASLSGCHRTEAAPSPATHAPDAAPAAVAIESADPSVVSASPASRSELEPTIAVTPKGAIAVAWTAVRADHGTAIGARFSPDGGAKWGPVQSIATPDDRAASDATLAADATGTIYLTWLGTGPNGPGNVPDSHVYLARALAGAPAFEPPVELTDAMHRGSKISSPGLAVTAAGAVVATWAYASPMGDGIGVARSLDGIKWTKGVVIERIDLGASLPHICASARGERMWIAYLDSGAGVRVRASDDGGATWSTSRVTTVSKPEERTLLAADIPVCTGDSDDVTVAYGRRKTAASPGTEAISIVKSYDGGRVFDARRTFESPSAPMLHPQLARESDGALDLAFYAGGPGGDAGALRWLRASDDKAQLGPSHVLRDHFHFEVADAAAAAAGPGKYFGWAWNQGMLYAASIDKSGDASHIAVTRIASH